MRKMEARRARDLQNAAVLAGLVVLAVLLRAALFPVKSGDYYQFLQPWFQQIRAGGGFSALAEPVGDYMPTYFYLMALLSYLPGPDLALIKFSSCAADFLLAFLVMRTVQAYRPGRFAGFAAFVAVLFFPPVFLNSAGWGQCDAMYICALLASFRACLHRRSWLAVLGFSIAFVLKLQAVFFAPFLLLLLLKRHLKWRSLLVLPAVYLAAILPAALLGRDFGEMLTVYIAQAGQYRMLCMGIPNLYAFIGENRSAELGRAGVALAAATVVLFLFVLWRREFPLTKENLLAIALFSLFFVPYVLPYMHERYFMAADLFGIVFALRFPRRFYIPLAIAVVDTMGQANFLFGLQPENPVRWMSFPVLGALALLGVFLFRRTGVRVREARGEAARRAPDDAVGF